MARKKVDARVRTLIENGVKSNHRSTFVLVGDYGKDQASKLQRCLTTLARHFFISTLLKAYGFSQFCSCSGLVPLM